MTQFHTDIIKTCTGGCLCGEIRYEANGAPDMAGHCYCADCRKASGSGFIPFMNYQSHAIRFSGTPRQFRSLSARGTDSVRNFCPDCGGLVFGGEVGKDTSHTIYAGSLDDPSFFEPKVAIFTAQRVNWAIIPPGLTIFDGPPD